MATLKHLTGGLEKRYVAFTIASPVTMIVEVVMETMIPLFMAQIIDVGIASHDMNYVLRVGGIMILCSLVSLSAGIGGGVFSAVASQGFSHNLRRKLFGKVQEFSFANIDKFSTGSLVTRLTSDVRNVENIYRMIIRMTVRAPFMLISATVMACILNRRLALIFAVAVPILVAAIAYLSISAYPRFQVMLKKYDTLNTTVQENLIAIRVVKAFVREPFEVKKFDDAAEDVRKSQVLAEKIVIRLMPIMQLVVYSSIIATLWFGGKMIVVGDMKTGELVSFLTYVSQILMSLMMLAMVFVSIVLSRASVTRIVEVLGEEVDIKSPDVLASGEALAGANASASAGASASENLSASRSVADGSIDFENVSFSYSKSENNLVLSDINLHIKSGQVVGIIGGTGSSKTTLVSLLPRLYDVTSGSVKVGGVDVRDYDLVALRDAVAMVLQKNVLFSGTIRDNLKWGNKNATDEEIIAACKAADAHDFIMGFTDGYDTMLGQGGVNVSGGQKQRLCIARALLKNPKILILDDSTSAVDTATEARIRAALRKQHPEVTKIIIAQRISSVRDADVIIVLDDGKINGVGRHLELLAINKIYREVFESQQNDTDIDIAGGA